MTRVCLNHNGPPRLMYLNTWSQVGKTNCLGRIRRQCSLLERAVSVERLWSFRSLHHSQCLLLSPACVSRWELSETAPVPHLPACLHGPCHDGPEFTLSNWNSLINLFFYKLPWSECIITAIIFLKYLRQRFKTYPTSRRNIKAQ